MSTPTVRKGRRRAWVAIATLGAALGLFLTIGAGAASAAFTCTYNGTFGELVILGDGATDAVTLKRTAGSGGFILVNGATCVDGALGAAASVLNTDTVFVDLDGDALGDSLTIDNTSGRVTEPGATTPEPDLNDIEFVIEDVEFLTYNDTNAAGAVTLGEANGVSDNWDGDSNQEAPVPGFPAGIGLFCGETVPTVGDPLANLNAFPADNDADVWDCDQDLIGITVNGLGGDDFISGKGGDGTGDPIDIPLILDGGTGNNEIEGGLNDDVIFANPGDVLDGNANNLVETDCLQDDTLGQWIGSATGGDTLNLSLLAGGFTIVFGEDGSITITPAPTIVAVDFENIVGSAGNDTITGNSLANFISGGPGNDVIDGRGGNDVLLGGDGDDTLAGGMGNDCVLGNAGNDVLDESAPLNADGTPAYAAPGYNGADALDGGPGLDDTVTYAARTDRTVVYLGIISWFNDGGDPDADATTSECDDVFFTTENAITGSGNDILAADFLNNQSDNEFTDGAGNDQATGGAGNDILHQGAAANGADVFEGDSGSDTADYSQRTNAVNVSLEGSGNDGEAGEGDNIDGATFAPGPRPIVCASGTLDSFNTLYNPGPGAFEPFWADEADDIPNNSVENVQGGSGNDVLSGNDNGNVLQGNAGNDTLSGGGGADSLQGGDGNDLLAGNLGNDSLDGGAGTNLADFQTAGVTGVGVQVNLATGVSSGEGNDVLTAIQNVAGSPFADNIRGDAGNNVLNGRSGNDAIQGGGGDDVINGGPGADELNGNGGNDTVRGQSGADTVRGAGGDDVLRGDLGNDTVLGGGGDDNLGGGSGKDFLNGGRGSDVCKPNAPGLRRGDVARNCES